MERVGSDRASFTPYQKLIVLDVPDDQVDSLIDELAPADLQVGGGVSGQAAAFGAAAQAVAAEIAAQLEKSALPAAANQALPLAGQR